jgi:hypothetical protein
MNQKWEWQTEERIKLEKRFVLRVQIVSLLCKTLQDGVHVKPVQDHDLPQLQQLHNKYV